MKIGINGLYLLPGGVGGTEIYLRCLLRALGELKAHRFVLFVGAEAAPTFTDLPKNFEVVEAPIRSENRPSRLLFEQLRLPRLCRDHKLDVLLNPGFTGPFLSSIPMVTVVHDLQYRDHPEYFSFADKIGWRVFADGAIARSTRLIAISEWTKRQLLANYPSVAGRVDVAAQGVDEDVLARRWMPDKERPYLLTISTLHPHKNLDMLLRAFAEYRRKNSAIRLIVAGLRGYAAESLERLREELQLREHVEFTYWIPRERLLDLLSGAWAFVFPSRYEGFGIPVAEALSMGIPTVCSDIPVLDEVAGSAALRFPVDSVANLSNALERITGDESLRAVLSREGPVQAQRFRWSATADATLASLQRALQSSPATSSKI